MLCHTQWGERDSEGGILTLFSPLEGYFLQVNLFQKRSFLHQLTHNMTTDCSLNYEFSTRKIQVQDMLCTKIVLNAKTDARMSTSEKDLPVCS